MAGNRSFHISLVEMEKGTITLETAPPVSYRGNTSSPYELASLFLGICPKETGKKIIYIYIYTHTHTHPCEYTHIYLYL